MSGHSLGRTAAVGGCWFVGVCVCVWSVLQKFSTTRLFSIFPQRADAVCCVLLCCCFFLLTFLFGTVLSLSHSLALYAFFVVYVYVGVRVCVYIRTYVGGGAAAAPAECVLVFALYNLIIYLNNSLFNCFAIARMLPLITFIIIFAFYYVHLHPL